MDLERVVDNRTPMAHWCGVVTDRHGHDLILVIAKMTWSVLSTGSVTIASPQSPVRLQDVPTSGEPMASIRYPSDLCVEKVGTDILLVGNAQPPPGRKVTEMEVALRIETGQRTIQKAIKVFGARVFQKGLLGIVPGPAADLRTTPLIYENAYGGTDNTELQNPAVEPQNPVGRGFAKNRSTLVGQIAPPLEDPRAPLSSKQPVPACFGAIRGSWAPRFQYAGTYDDVWRKTRAPLRPIDFEPRFHNVAPPDLQTDVPLGGNEPVEVTGTSVGPIWRFQLPRYAPVFTITVQGTKLECSTWVDTFLIDADERRVEVTYRATVPMPRKVEQIEKVLIMGAPKLADALIEELAERIRARRSVGA